MSSPCQLRTSAICDTVCQVTHGKKPEWANTPYAHWIKSRLAELGWQKKDLIAALVATGEQREPGAAGLVGRVTARGAMPDQKNRALITAVLGPEPESLRGDRPDRLEELLEQVIELLEEVLAERPPRGPAAASSAQ